ncbi:(S)-acetoin forming diacetyl reductase [Staphylococcus simiae]|uniref:(S)-acetoin forming diacetyl reductase n=1 Tax=Staphylococcus simiae TaxID=308354 RepID=UPI001A97164D|nr:(S)-acetoin forming diacetyl reductase [Staphylococcus simiae]MBO1198435.1 (S)-acetoin forming diacetyl reductase [Staphylococcus simiae]MBO1200629.1 (S)-acetoin forming diacetyl reductase [Staphylococcus simiae]MBO1202900.1 (S)-acetoin forming diacetyl reductase [Staphylococcus simiae]MBO1210426.1 (S)-acetoin forming diacetyl reductase [Staphylococcus simiae]MBO1228966.1 (S)-acetoin forming diacetyl reductase [Staphylococcus simiae]
MTNNKVAVVTGGAQGIGFKISERLFNDGFNVAIVDYNEQGAQQAAQQLSSDGSRAIAIKADVANRDDVFNAVRQTVEHFGDFHVIVNNAGLGPMTPIDSITPEQFDKVYGVNVAGVLWGIQAAHEQFKQLNHGGKIINATSQAGVEGNAGLSLYSSTKFAVRGLTQVAARDLALEGITVNAFAPGIVNTPMMESIAKSTAEEAGQPEEWGWQQFSSQIALGRLSEPEDVSNVVGFLAGKDSDYITGQTIIVDGGMRFH